MLSEKQKKLVMMIIGEEALVELSRVVEEIKNEGNNLNYTFEYDGSRWTLLQLALEKNNKEVINLLLNSGAIDVNARYDYQCTELGYGIMYGRRKKIIESLLAIGANINQEDEFRWSTLHYAAMTGRAEIVKLLLDRGLNINLEDKDKRTALYYAIMNDKKEVIKVLLDRGANIDQQDKDKKTVLYYAVMNEKKELIELLLSIGANVNQEDDIGRTILDYAIMYGKRKEVIELLDRVANIYQQDKYKRTALHYAIINDRLEIVDLLLDRGAKINQEDDIGRTALHYAASNGRIEIVNLLLVRGANINQEDNIGRTALHYAAMNGRMGIIDLLLARGSDINKKDKFGKTALHYAAMNEKKEVTDALLARWASINQEEEYKARMLYYAAMNGRAEAIQVFLINGANVNVGVDMFWTNEKNKIIVDKEDRRTILDHGIENSVDIVTTIILSILSDDIIKTNVKERVRELCNLLDDKINEKSYDFIELQRNKKERYIKNISILDNLPQYVKIYSKEVKDIAQKMLDAIKIKIQEYKNQRIREIQNQMQQIDEINSEYKKIYNFLFDIHIKVKNTQDKKELIRLIKCIYKINTLRYEKLDYAKEFKINGDEQNPELENLFISLAKLRGMRVIVQENGQENKNSLLWTGRDL